MHEGLSDEGAWHCNDLMIGCVRRWVTL